MGSRLHRKGTCIEVQVCSPGKQNFHWRSAILVKRLPRLMKKRFADNRLFVSISVFEINHCFTSNIVLIFLFNKKRESAATVSTPRYKFYIRVFTCTEYGTLACLFGKYKISQDCWQLATWSDGDRVTCRLW